MTSIDNMKQIQRDIYRWVTRVKNENVRFKVKQEIDSLRYMQSERRDNGYSKSLLQVLGEMDELDIDDDMRAKMFFDLSHLMNVHKIKGRYAFDYLTGALEKDGRYPGKRNRAIIKVEDILYLHGKYKGVLTKKEGV